MLVNSKQMFSSALEKKYALGAFNFVNMEGLTAIISAAEECNSPVIIQCSTSAIKYAGDKLLSAMVKSVCKDSHIPICWNLDHGKTLEDCKHAISLGFTNVMIDASSLPFEENIALTKQVVDYAHKKGVTVEAELGVLAGIEDEVKVSSKESSYTNPEMAAEFVKRTKVDSLAIAIGTSHGAYKFKGESQLRIDILKQIEKRLPNFPLVLHGASSIPQTIVALAEKYGARLEGSNGIPEDVLKKVCKMNVCKINVDSDLRLAFMAGIRESLYNDPKNIDMRKYLTAGSELIKQTVKHKISNVFMSKNKA